MGVAPQFVLAFTSFWSLIIAYVFLGRSWYSIIDKSIFRIILLPNYSILIFMFQSQAHLKFRRGSDTLLMTSNSSSSSKGNGPSYTPPLRHRAAQLVPDDTTNAAIVARRIGKGQ